MIIPYYQPLSFLTTPQSLRIQRTTCSFLVEPTGMQSLTAGAEAIRGRGVRIDKVRVMGILNVTADSFSDGGKFLDHKAAVTHARDMLRDGADIIDIGGESTRPGAETVGLQQELDRVMPVLEVLVAELGASVSLDTSKAALMQEGTRLGARMINDVRALSEPGALKAASVAATELGCEICIMHMQGQPATMQQQPGYEDVVAEVSEFLRSRAAECVRAGIPAEKLLIDPGFGFGKTTRHNLRLLNQLHKLCELGHPVLAGLSRKRMFGEILANQNTGEAFDGDRVHASVAAAQIAICAGASIVRVHDVAATAQALKVVQSVSAVPPG